MPESANTNASPAASDESAGGLTPANDNSTPGSFDDKKIAHDYTNQYLPRYHKTRSDHLSRANPSASKNKITQSGNVTRLEATTLATPQGEVSSVPTPANDNGVPLHVENVSGSGQGVEASKTGDNKINVEFKTKLARATGYPPPLSLAEYSKLARQGKAPTGDENLGAAMPPQGPAPEPSGEGGVTEPTESAPPEETAPSAAGGSVPTKKPRKKPGTGEPAEEEEPGEKEKEEEEETPESIPTPSPEAAPEQEGPTPSQPSQAGPRRRGPAGPGGPPTGGPEQAEPGEQPEGGAPGEGEPGEEPSQAVGPETPEGETAPEGQAGKGAEPGTGEQPPAEGGTPPESGAPGVPPTVGPGQSEEVAEGLGKAPKKPEGTPAEGAPPAAEGTTPGEATPAQQQDAGSILGRRRRELERQRASLRAKLDELNGKITTTRKSKELQIIKFFLPKLYNQVSGAFTNVELKSQEALVAVLETKVATLTAAKRALQAAEGIAAFIDAVIQWVRWIIYLSESIIGAIIVALLFFIIIPMLFIEKLGVEQGGLTGAVKKVVKDVNEILEPMQKQLATEKQKLVYLRKIRQIDIELGGGPAANVGGAGGKTKAPGAGGNEAEGGAPGAPGEPPKTPATGAGLAASPKVPSGQGSEPPKLAKAA